MAPSPAQADRQSVRGILCPLYPRPGHSEADQLAAMAHTRLSIPEISDDSDSEPDLSTLGMTRARPAEMAHMVEGHEAEYDVHATLEAEDTSVEEDLQDADVAEQQAEGEEGVEYQEMLVDPAALGLKEISNLGRFTVSSHKQGNSVDELRNDDLNLYWQ